jgi:hypothetical protein
MPYADPEKQKEAQARWYRKKYEQDRKFRTAEAERKAAWLQTPEGRMSNAESSARFRRLGEGEHADAGVRSRGGDAVGAGKRGGGGVGVKAKPKLGTRKVARGSGAGKANGGAKGAGASRGALKKNRPVKGGVSKKGGPSKGGPSAKARAMQYDESKPKEVKAFARMVQTLQGTGVTFVVGRRGKRIALRVGV